ncbi:PREDICTED: NADH dehydrogenase [ubiquinone] 1 beta subcomplex subunit 10 [Dinoponera quadriceps]|uniref:NADH dehydrogenase [ubiquinone] 1 beta subcomplex subunit 10 n=1 Tax=Dinoponera quadriceps TaxID=609295 RepID=A0A6P3WTH2_DINQU|nr:PREDICTED: NADH dehydrogenase [ubiquinone] 1 beta subcomplex subunit 10 [Dinoponera quadriceps]
MAEKENILVRIYNNIFYMFDAPATYFREKFVEPNQKKYPWYHQKYRRVPNIDECYSDDVVCFTEANCQFLRDKLVDDEILFILRSRFEQCAWYHGEDDVNLCKQLRKTYDDATTAWFIKYGDMGISLNVVNAYMKQKHRMVWERRHGPVGSGMKEQKIKV